MEPRDMGGNAAGRERRARGEMRPPVAGRSGPSARQDADRRQRIERPGEGRGAPRSRDRLLVRPDADGERAPGRRSRPASGGRPRDVRSAAPRRSGASRGKSASFGVYGRPDQARRRVGFPLPMKLVAGALALALAGFGVAAALPKGGGDPELPSTAASGGLSSGTESAANGAEGGVGNGAVPAAPAVAVGFSDAADPLDAQLAKGPLANQPRTVTVTFAGDCTLGTDEHFGTAGSFPEMYAQQGDPSYFLRNVSSIFEADDLTVVNMEGTLTEETARADKTFTFKGPAEYTQILTGSSVEVASMANNHSRDYGAKSYTDTIDALEAAGVPTFGYDRTGKLTVNGAKVALVGYSTVYDGMAVEDDLVASVKEAREDGADLVLVYMHWGIEKDTVPNTGQMKLARSAIDAGADLVVGSHPHVIQGWETYKGRYIVYSLENFCFGGNHNPPDYDCMIFQQTFTVAADGVAERGEARFIPCQVSSVTSRNNYQPTPAEGDEAQRISQKIQRSCDAIAELAKTL